MLKKTIISVSHCRLNNTSSLTVRPELWKCNIRKRLREMGLSYIDSRGRSRKARTIGPTCPLTCHYECSLNFNNDERVQLHKYYWSLNNNEKKSFHFKYINKIHVKRKRSMEENSRRSNTFCYYFPLNNKSLQVCKIFYLKTLCISCRVIYNLFKKIAIVDDGTQFDVTF